MTTNVNIGVSTGRGAVPARELLKRLGIEIENLDGRDICPRATIIETPREKLNRKHLVKLPLSLFPSKPIDLCGLLLNGSIDVAVGFTDTIVGHENDVRIVAKLSVQDLEAMGFSRARICMVCRKGDLERCRNTRYNLKIVSEYDSTLFSDIFEMRDYTVCRVSGSAETWVAQHNADLAVTIVQSGSTLIANNLEIYRELTDLEMAIYVRRGRWNDAMNYFLFTFIQLKIIIDGVDGSGKTTLAKRLEKEGYIVQDRSCLTEYTMKNQEEWPNTLEDFAVWIVLDANMETLLERISKRGKSDKWETPSALNYFKHKYRALAMFYGLYYIDTTNHTPESLYEEVTTNLNAHILPHIRTLDLTKCKIVAEGNSKIVYEIHSNYDFVVYKPTVHSFKSNRAGVVEGTDLARLISFRSLLELAWANSVPHSAVCVTKRGVVVERLREEIANRVEVIYKRCFVGSDKHRYEGMEEYMKDWERFEDIIVLKQPYVRFDWRNKLPKADETVTKELLEMTGCMHVGGCDNAEKLVKRMFTVLQEYEKECGIFLIDQCFMVTKDGKKLTYEFSPDCARARKLTSNDSLDKDVWRRGGSSDQVVEKWMEFAKLVSAKIVPYIMTQLNL